MRRRLTSLILGSLGLVVSVLLLVSGSVAHAQDSAAAQSADADARQLFEAGRVSYERGRYELALQQFEEAHRLSGRAVLLFNIATTLDRLRRDAEALDAFERFLAAEPEHPSAPLARERVSFLRERVEAAERAAAQPDAPELPLAPASDAPASDGDDIVGAWWLWTLVAVVVVGVGVGVGLGVGLDPQRELPIAGPSAIIFEF